MSPCVRGVVVHVRAMKTLDQHFALPQLLPEPSFV